jgi:hypothetical protein
VFTDENQETAHRESTKTVYQGGSASAPVTTTIQHAGKFYVHGYYDCREFLKSKGNKPVEMYEL